MDEAIGTEHLAVKLQEAGRYEPLACLLHLRVGEGNPYLVDLPGGKETGKQLYAGADECDVGHLLFGSRLGAAPDAGALDVDADVVLGWLGLRQANSVLALATAEFEHYRRGVVEIVLAPATAQRESAGGL